MKTVHRLDCPHCGLAAAVAVEVEPYNGTLAAEVVASACGCRELYDYDCRELCRLALRLRAARRPAPRTESAFARQREQFEPRAVLGRYPRLVAHLICESLGYFTPAAAALALVRHRLGEPHFCEWYNRLSSLPARAGSSGAEVSYAERLRLINREVIAAAFRRRHDHGGATGDYRRAREIVARRTGRSSPRGSN
jgi:hypothetical protein